VTVPNVEATCPGPTGFGTELSFVLCSLGACSDYLPTNISYAPPRIDNMTATSRTDGCGDPHAAVQVNITEIPTTGSFTRLAIFGENFGNDNSVVCCSSSSSCSCRLCVHYVTCVRVRLRDNVWCDSPGVVCLQPWSAGNHCMSNYMSLI
jgi:hypothetical protein